MEEDKITIECPIDWYDGPFLAYTADQMYEIFTKLHLDVGNKVRMTIEKMKE